MKLPTAIPGSQVYEKPVSSLDIFATVAFVANLPLPADRPYDGVNLVPFLTNGDGIPHEIFLLAKRIFQGYL